MAKSIQELYRELLDVLASGAAAAVVSEYRLDGSISKRLVSADDARAWAEINQLEARPDATASGPVTSIVTNAGAATGTDAKAESSVETGAVTSADTTSAAPAAITLVEHYTTKPRMLILGAGHIAAQLAPIAKQAEFELLIYDDRRSFANAENFPDADSIICDGFDQLFKRVQLRATDYVVIVTRGHKHDADCLRGILAGTEPAYTGMIGSRRRVAIVMDQLRDEGYDAERIARIHSPIGLKIGAVTPFEIAISIISEIIQVKRLERGGGELASCDPDIAEVLARRGDDFDALITIYRTEGSVPIDTGAKLAMTYTGELAGTIGGGCSEAEAMQVARETIRGSGSGGSASSSSAPGSASSNGASAGSAPSTWRTHSVDMTDSAEQDGMVCGGMMQVLIERIG
ncbi:MAG: XdhC family protein [Coriobacteriales bacterium]|jgi:xanthine dehydrogenase accessory factor|nr:XdhC family protein [Coriobacteriales bacterium]